MRKSSLEKHVVWWQNKLAAADDCDPCELPRPDGFAPPPPKSDYNQGPKVHPLRRRVFSDEEEKQWRRNDDVTTW
jgi:hypothetical protein